LFEKLTYPKPLNYGKIKITCSELIEILLIPTSCSAIESFFNGGKVSINIKAILVDLSMKNPQLRQNVIPFFLTSLVFR